jgi:hypothetical protein
VQPAGPACLTPSSETHVSSLASQKRSDADLLVAGLRSIAAARQPFQAKEVGQMSSWPLAKGPWPSKSRGCDIKRQLGGGPNARDARREDRQLRRACAKSCSLGNKWGACTARRFGWSLARATTGAKESGNGSRQLQRTESTKQSWSAAMEEQRGRPMPDRAWCCAFVSSVDCVVSQWSEQREAAQPVSQGVVAKSAGALSYCSSPMHPQEPFCLKDLRLPCCLQVSV